MPFSAWLPAAMAAPTPVSALVHSSTLVTAGVYLLIRFSPLLSASGVAWALALTAFLTTIMARISALWECDLKKIVALSTLSQLGVIVITVAAGLPQLAMFHLLSHATFKALLFMCSGKIIHTMGDTQDIRIMGGITRGIPVTVSFFNLANLALCGFPFLAGFYSKDLLVESLLIRGLNMIALCLITVIVRLSSAYSVRLSFLSFINHPSLHVAGKAEDEDVLILGAYVILGGLAVTSGAALSWLLLPSPPIVTLVPPLKILTLTLMLAGAAIGAYIRFSPKDKAILAIETLINMWLLPHLSGSLPTKIRLKANKRASSLDIGWAELLGGKGGHILFTNLSSHLPKGTFAPLLSYQLLGGVTLLLALSLVYPGSLNKDITLKALRRATLWVS